MSDDFFTENSPVPEGALRDDYPNDALPDMDALFEQSVNMDDVRQTQADSLKAPGSYVTVPALSVQARRVEEGANAGRLMIRFFGPAELTVTEKNYIAVHSSPGNVIRGQFGFGISPERANKVKNGEDSGEPDHPSKLWAQAVSAYEQAYKEKPKQIGDVVRYVQNYPVVLRVIQVGVPTERNPEPDGEPGNIVMAISAPRQS